MCKRWPSTSFYVLYRSYRLEKGESGGLQACFTALWQVYLHPVLVSKYDLIWATVGEGANMDSNTESLIGTEEFIRWKRMWRTGSAPHHKDVIVCSDPTQTTGHGPLQCGRRAQTPGLPSLEKKINTLSKLVDQCPGPSSVWVTSGLIEISLWPQRH